jgi:superfamily II DNA helicase RecQ
MHLEPGASAAGVQDRLRELLRRAEAEDHRRLQALLAYIDSEECRAQFLARYFANPIPAPCGHCDRCSPLGSNALATEGTEGTESEAHAATTDDVLAAEIYERLRGWRRIMAERAGQAPFEVLSESALRAVSERQPRSPIELVTLPDTTPEQIEVYGDAILEIVMETTAAGRAPAEAVHGDGPHQG